jgi:hypothetical protein
MLQISHSRSLSFFTRLPWCLVLSCFARLQEADWALGLGRLAERVPCDAPALSVFCTSLVCFISPCIECPRRFQFLLFFIIKKTETKPPNKK